MTIVVVEGCDGSGKTTLIERARENQRDRYFMTVRASRYPPDIASSFQYLQWVKYCPHDCILDRIHFISDRIYGPILRDEDLFKALPLQFGIQQMGAVVYARPPTEVILENLSHSVHLRGVVQNAERIIERYDEVMDTLKLRGVKVLKFDYTQDEPVGFWRYVWEEARKQKAGEINA